MLTNQVGELTADLDKLIRKHEGRDLTRTEIVRQLATEGCVILQKDGGDLGSRLMNSLCGLVVSVAACLPQTVDETENITEWKADRRMWKWLHDILRVITDTVWDDVSDHRRLARELLDQGVVVLTEIEGFTSDRERAALKLVQQARELLCESEEAAA